VRVSPHLHLVPRSRMRGAIPPLPNTPSWNGAQLMHKDNFTFYLYILDRLDDPQSRSGLVATKGNCLCRTPNPGHFNGSCLRLNVQVKFNGDMSVVLERRKWPAHHGVGTLWAVHALGPGTSCSSDMTDYRSWACAGNSGLSASLLPGIYTQCLW
jgi:hypothetical protein